MLDKQLQTLSIVSRVYPSDANFLVVKVPHATSVYDFLLEKRIVVHDRSKVELCEGCLRITVGTEQENKELMNTLTQFRK